MLLKLTVLKQESSRKNKLTEDLTLFLEVVFCSIEQDGDLYYEFAPAHFYVGPYDQTVSFAFLHLSPTRRQQHFVCCWDADGEYLEDWFVVDKVKVVNNFPEPIL